MNILYGVQATGHGHIVRSASMVRHLRALGHRVHCLVSGREPAQIPGIRAFEPYTSLRGFTGSVGGGKLRVVESALGLRIPHFFGQVRRFDAADIDVVVTDYEPASAYIARRNGLPSLGLGHMYSFRSPLPLRGFTRPAQLLVGLFPRLFTPVRHAVGLHWAPFGGANLPPTIAPEIRSLSETPTAGVRDDKVVVYLPAESEQSIVEVLGAVQGVEFFVYRATEGDSDCGNVHFRPHDRDRFVGDLADAGGVLTHCGFSLTSEALHLGRRLLVKPIRRHPEQFLNGRALETLGYGKVTHLLSASVVEEWLQTPRPAPMSYPDVLRPLAEWIGRAQWRQTQELVATTWSGVGGETA